MAKVFAIGIRYYLIKVIYPCLFFAVLCPIPGYIIHLFMLESFTRFLVVSGVIAFWGIILTYALLLDKDERKKIVSIIKQKNNA